MTERNLDPYLSFSGNCSEAFAFYVERLGAKLESSFTFGQSPMAGQVPPDFANKMMHAKLTLDGRVLMGSDVPPGMPTQPMGGFSLSLNYPTVAAAKAAFAALSDGANVAMPIDKTFWADAFGMLTDKFGVPWMIGCEKER